MRDASEEGVGSGDVAAALLASAKLAFRLGAAIQIPAASDSGSRNLTFEFTGGGWLLHSGNPTTLAAEWASLTGRTRAQMNDTALNRSDNSEQVCSSCAWKLILEVRPPTVDWAKEIPVEIMAAACRALLPAEHRRSSREMYGLRHPVRARNLRRRSRQCRLT
jgi:hypothetical protein